MGLESATYISGLNSSNPTTGDAKTEGDDHIRLIKATLLATFPSITGAVTKTHTELNAALGTGGSSFNGRDSDPRTTAGTYVTYTEIHDTLSNFNNTTGVFTAPVTGIYMLAFSTSGYTSSGAGTHRSSLFINGSGAISLLMDVPLSTATSTVGVSGAVSLTASDLVRIELESISGTGATVFVRSFSGHRIG